MNTSPEFNEASRAKAEKARKDEKDQGLIIAREDNQKLLYALNTIKDMDLRLHEVEFRLFQAAKLGEQA